MVSKRIWLVLEIVVIALQLICEALLLYLVCRMNVLTASLTAVLIAVLVLLFAITSTIAFAGLKKASAKDRTVRGIIAVIFAIITIAFCITGCFTLSAAQRTITTVTKPGKINHIIGVYVLKDDPAQSIADAENYKFGYMESLDGSDYIQQTILAIQSEFGHHPDVAEYNDTTRLVNALYAQEVQAIILDKGFASIIEDQPDYTDFADRTRLIYEHDFSKKLVVPEIIENGITAQPFVLYISGSDTRSNMLDVSRSDVNILAVVNPVTKQVLLVNTPRDYYVPISISSSGARDKLTHCGIYGVDCSMDTLSELYGVGINYYCQINFTGFETLVDAIGGVTVYSDTAFSLDQYRYVKGYNDMDGASALAFSRDRYHQASGDNARGIHQMAVIKGIIQKMTAGTIIQNYTDILSSIEGMFLTSLSSDEISQLIKMQLSDMATWDVHSFAVTGTGGSSKTFSMPGLSSYVMYPNENTVAHASNLMNKVIEGDFLTDADMKVPK